MVQALPVKDSRNGAAEQIREKKEDVIAPISPHAVGSPVEAGGQAGSAVRGRIGNIMRNCSKKILTDQYACNILL